MKNEKQWTGGDTPKQHYTTNPAWTDTCLDRCPENSDAWYVCNSLYKIADGYIKIMQRGSTPTIKAYPALSMRDPAKVAAILGQRGLDRRNLYISVGTYRHNDSYTMDNLLTLNAICIDVDYTSSRDASISGLSINDALRKFYGDILLDEYIPIPTYIEAGRNFRLVYVLNQPFFISSEKKKREATFSFFRRIGNVISQIIMEHGDWSVDHYQVAPMIRVPESTNVKWSTETVLSNGRRQKHFSIDTEYQVNIAPQYNTYHMWDIQKLAESVLPQLPEWHKKWTKADQKRKNTTKSKTMRTDSTGELMCSRMKDLITYQKYLGNNDIGNREIMTFLFRLTAYQSGMSETEAINAALEFNHGFVHPLADSRVITECKPSNNDLKYKNITIRDMLQCPDQLHLFAGDGLSRRDRYIRDRDAKIADGSLVTKKCQLEQTYDTIAVLQSQGLNRKQISEKLNIPIGTLSRYIGTMKKI